MKSGNGFRKALVAFVIVEALVLIPLVLYILFRKR
jgi:hypothetical protein